jgi:hypothetical protein
VISFKVHNFCSRRPLWLHPLRAPEKPRNPTDADLHYPVS